MEKPWVQPSPEKVCIIISKLTPRSANLPVMFVLKRKLLSHLAQSKIVLECVSLLNVRALHIVEKKK